MHIISRFSFGGGTWPMKNVNAQMICTQVHPLIDNNVTALSSISRTVFFKGCGPILGWLGLCTLFITCFFYTSLILHILKI